MTAFKYDPGPFEPISDEKFKKRLGHFFREMGVLYDIMPTLTHEEYRRRFRETFDLLNDLGDNFVLPNTTRIEQREFEVFGKRWHEYPRTMEYTKEQIEEWKAKAEKWDKLNNEIGKFYVDADGNELSDSDGGDLVDIAEVAAMAFGYL